MSSYTTPSEFPDLEFILEWGNNSHLGLCCGIFGCAKPVMIRCKICKGGYCIQHKEWHMHSDKFNGVIIKND